MRKSSLILITVISFGAHRATAQVVSQGSNHLFLGLGFPNIARLVLDNVPEGASSGIGPIVLAYQSGIRNKLALGAQIGYTSATSGEVFWSDPSGQSNAYRWAVSLVTIIAKADYHYLKSTRSDLYSGLGLGYGIASVGTTGSRDPKATTLTGGGFTWSVNLIGYRYMFSDKLGAYAELGLGSLGVVNIGLSKKF